MKKKVLFFLVFFSFTLASSAKAQFPQSWSDLNRNCVETVTVDDQQIEVATIQGFECIFINLVRIATPIVGILLFIMLVVGAFKYITSGGDPKKTQEAQQTLTFAVLGLVLFLGIWFILQLIKIITGVDVTQFKIPGPND